MGGFTPSAAHLPPHVVPTFYTCTCNTPIYARMPTESSKEPYYAFYRMDDILAKPAEFERQAMRQLLGG